MNFDPAHPEAAMVRSVALSSCGLKPESDEQSLLTSLPCELCFNDLRDGERRAQKNAYRTPSALCTGAIGSGWARSPLTKVSVESQDWIGCQDVNTLRSNILSSSRQLDRDLGISLQDLTTKFSCEHLTKPHVLTQRLLLFRALLQEFKQNEDVKLEKLLSESWTCRLLQAATLWRVRGQENELARLIVAAGPQVIRYVEVEQVIIDGSPHFKLNVNNPDIKISLEFDGLSGTLSKVTGVCYENHGLLLRAEAWLCPKRFLLTHRILDVPAGFIAQYCKLCNVGSSKSTHKERVKMLLESEAYPAEYVEDVLDNLPNRVRQPRGNDETVEATKQEMKQHFFFSSFYNIIGIFVLFNARKNQKQTIWLKKKRSWMVSISTLTTQRQPLIPAQRQWLQSRRHLQPLHLRLWMAMLYQLNEQWLCRILHTASTEINALSYSCT